MKSRTTKKFRKSFNKLPENIRKQAKEVFTLFQKDPYHPRLHFKRIHSSMPVYSVRITKNYRVIGVLKNAEIVWFWIGSHSDYNNLLKQL